jgi:glycosyltransferase involved in cell wall biosynthesis
VSEPGIAAIVLTKDEERDLPECLESLKGVAWEVVVVDSGSKDGTVAIAKRYGARVVHHEFVTYAAQFNWALENLQTEAAWVLRIDADERLSEELRESLRTTLPGLAEDVTGLWVPLRTRFMGRTLRWGDSYPVWLLRVFRRGKARCEDTWMDEHIVVDGGEVRRIKGDLIHEIPKSLSEWTRKHDWYAERECRDILRRAGNGRDPAGQAGVKRALKKHVYLRLPPFFRAFLYWFYRYFLKLGFLDGKEGLIYHFLHAFWYRFLVDARLFELKKALSAGKSDTARTQPL